MKIIVILCSVLLSITASAEIIKIGYIDTEQVVNNLSQYQKRVLEISKEFEPKKQELLDLFNNIELLREKIDTINKSGKKENLQIKLSELASLEESFKQETEFWQEIMNNKKFELLQQIELLINNTIKSLAISESYDLILYENAAFVSDEVNITYKIIERIEKLSL
ncbi:OmpH family outer membrane protein [Candidatus Pseudothioglobus sp. Uisw_016]|uniref:OmpH family outer membrane protein n=1 Tax=Candidatus Pseudothioglobus sp. Uisw_016 TaxID=3230995 RepID=UPI003A88C0B8